MTRVGRPGPGRAAITSATESLYVISGVGSDEWEYDLDSGLLCRVD